MSSHVLDAYALLALLQVEPGAERVAEIVSSGDALMGAVNLSEVAAKLSENGLPEAEIRLVLDGLQLETVDFTREQSFLCASLRTVTRHAGLGIGDRACLALAIERGIPALTTDTLWAALPIAARVELVR